MCCARGCGPRTLTGLRGRNWRASSNGFASVGQKPGFAATAGRDGTWCDDNDVDDLFGLSRNARLTERVGRQQVAQPLRFNQRGLASVLRLPLPDPGVLEPRVVVAVRNRECSSFVQERAHDLPAEPGFRTADRPENRADNPELASRSDPG